MSVYTLVNVIRYLDRLPMYYIICNIIVLVLIPCAELTRLSSEDIHHFTLQTATAPHACIEQRAMLSWVAILANVTWDILVPSVKQVC